EAGAFRRADPETLAWSFIGMIAHHAQCVSVFRFDPRPRPREDVLADAVDVFLDGVVNRAAHNKEEDPRHAKELEDSTRGNGSGPRRVQQKAGS
ncbi:MAG TPA: TetR/AcrR family transcriptional regulator C-terminal domain-containing protein, partial [Bryobacteraceae bacterium]